MDSTESPNIGTAITVLYDGKHVSRAGWNRKDMFLELQVPDANSKMTEPYIYINIPNADGKTFTRLPWTASQTDLLATDWQIVQSTA